MEEAIRAVAEAGIALLAEPISCFSSVAGDAVEDALNGAADAAVDAFAFLAGSISFEWTIPNTQFLTKDRCFQIAQSSFGGSPECSDRIACDAQDNSEGFEPATTVDPTAPGPVHYGVRVAISRTPEIQDDCGYYGCEVGYVDTEDSRMRLGRGSDTPDAFYLRGTVSSNVSDCVRYGDEIAISWSPDADEGCVNGELSICNLGVDCYEAGQRQIIRLQLYPTTTLFDVAPFRLLNLSFLKIKASCAHPPTSQPIPLG